MTYRNTINSKSIVRKMLKRPQFCLCISCLLFFTMSLTYHAKHNVITCACGKLITGKHTCDIKLSKIEVVVCDYYSSCSSSKSEQPCSICVVKEQEQKFEEQWDTDESGYCICAECKDKTDYGIPKHCSCRAFIGIDGEPKCKRCLNRWTEPWLDSGECGECGYEGE